MPYHNPNNLVYYLLPKLPSEQIQILKQDAIDSVFGKIEIGIIGSSHYIYLPNSFCELLTCQKLENIPALFQTQIAGKKNIFHKSMYGIIDYSFQLISENNKNEQFNTFEAQLSAAEHLLILSFNDKSAYTAIDFLINSDKDIVFSTIHTYPETLTIVKSKTHLTIRDI